MNWSREMGKTYAEGHEQGKKDFILGQYREDDAEKYDFKMCFRQGYQHGWLSLRKEYLHSNDWDKVEIARKRTPLVKDVKLV